MKLEKEKVNLITKLFEEKTRKDCYALNMVDEEPSILDDKLGGKPYLPVGEKYPTDDKGNPLPLMLQINLKNIDLPNFPKEGILEVFTDTNWPLNYKVKYFKEGLEYQTEFPEAKCYYTDYEGKEHETEFFVEKPQKIVLEKTVCYLPMSNYEFDDVISEVIAEALDLDLDEVDLEEYFGGWDVLHEFEYDVLNSLKFNPCTLGGYPDYTQDDIREDFDPPKDVCLFKLDSVGTKYLEIGDSGIMCGYISTEDLKNCNFDNMALDFDCC